MNYYDEHNFPQKTNFKTFPDFSSKFYYKADRIEFLHISLCMHEIFESAQFCFVSICIIFV